jgi:4-diphosphocytidyl-2-C-methyl-D-erythritol kinase
MDTVTKSAPAKINLFLRVVGKRPDGYHDLYSLMCPVALYDTLSLDFGGSGISVTCDHPGVPQDGSNLAIRSVRLFLDAVFAGSSPSGFGLRIHIEKKIPVGAGLGGGSSNAAAVLTALNHYFGQPLSTPALMALGGASVPMFPFLSSADRRWRRESATGSIPFSTWPPGRCCWSIRTRPYRPPGSTKI